MDLVRLTPGGISRAQLAAMLGLSRAAVTGIVDDLLRRRVLLEIGSRSSNGGRRAVLLDLNPQLGRLLGIDIGATHIRMVMTDLAAQVMAETETSWAIESGPEACLQQLDRMLNSLRTQGRSTVAPMVAIGAGVPGPVVAQEGVVIAPPIMPGWDGFPIVQRLEDMWGLKVNLHNDADLGALGEWAYGAGRGEQNMVYVKVGTGVGAGFLIDGRIHRGASGTAGEIGHITIDPNGPLCTCGNHGCLEAMAGGNALAQRAIRAVREGAQTVLSTHAPLESLTVRDVAEAAARGDHLSQRLLADAGRLIGIAVAALVNLFNPSLVVVGGGVAQVGDLLLDPIRMAVQERALRASAASVRIQAAVLGRRSSAMGAIASAQHHAVRMIAGAGR